MVDFQTGLDRWAIRIVKTQQPALQKGPHDDCCVTDAGPPAEEPADEVECDRTTTSKAPQRIAPSRQTFGESHCGALCADQLPNRRHASEHPQECEHRCKNAPCSSNTPARTRHAERQDAQTTSLPRDCFQRVSSSANWWASSNAAPRLTIQK